jgi:tetratricopeptide (TPR) repeat protein
MARAAQNTGASSAQAEGPLCAKKVMKYSVPLIYLFLLPLTFPAFVIAGTPASPDHPELRRAMDLTRQRAFTEATAILTDALSNAERNHDEAFQATILNNLGAIYQKQGKYADSESAYNKSISYVTRLGGANAPELGPPLGNLGALYYEAGQYSHAEKLFVRAREIFSAAGENGPPVGKILNNLGSVYLLEPKDELAEQTAARSVKNILTKGRQ